MISCATQYDCFVKQNFRLNTSSYFFIFKYKFQTLIAMYSLNT